MSWTTDDSWQICTVGGSPGTWVSVTTQGYPGELNVAGAVTIQATHKVTANFTSPIQISVTGVNGGVPFAANTTPNPIGKLTVNNGGTLTLLGNTGSTNRTTYIQTSEVNVVPTTGTISFGDKANLALPANAVLYVNPGGLSGSINANVNIYIGNWYAIGTSNQTYYNFTQITASGGTINAVITTPVSSTICQGTTLSLQGYFTGSYSSTTSTATTPYGVTYEWYDNGNRIATATGTIILTPPTLATSTNASHTPINYTPTLGIHTLGFRVTSYLGTTLYENTETRTITVNPTSVVGTATAAVSPLCSGNSTTISLNGYTGTIQWQQ